MAKEEEMATKNHNVDDDYEYFYVAETTKTTIVAHHIIAT